MEVALLFYVVMSAVQKKKKTREKARTHAGKRRLKLKRIMNNMKTYSLHQDPASLFGDLLLIPLKKEDVRVQYERSLDSQDDIQKPQKKGSLHFSKLKSGLQRLGSLVRVPRCFGSLKKNTDISIDVPDDHACESSSTCDIAISTCISIQSTAYAHSTCTHTPHGVSNGSGLSEEHAAPSSSVSYDQCEDTDSGTYTEAPTSTIHNESPVLDVGEPALTKICAGLECPICIQPFRPGDQIFKLPVCGHLCHSACGISWLVKRPYCLVCKHDVLGSRRGREGHSNRTARENRRRSEHNHIERSKKRTSRRHERTVENEA